MKRVAIAFALIALVAAGGWFWGAPWWTLYAMKEAAEARDMRALSASIDYPAVRDSLKRQLREGQAGTTPGGPLGALLAGEVTDRAVDLAVNPEGMRVIFAAAPLATDRRPGAVPLKASDLAMHRDGLTRFRLSRRDGTPGALVFRLHGARWKLSEIELPPKGI